MAEAEKDDGQAQYQLALLHLAGEDVNGEPLEQSEEIAFGWLTKASKHNVVEAEVELGDFNLEGRGIPINPTEAARLYRAAADQGNMEAEARLGWISAHGLGVSWDGEEALRRYTNADHGGSAFGLWGLADMYLTGNGVVRNHELGMSYGVKAAEMGCAPALLQMGLLMLAGSDNPSIAEHAIAYIHQAAQAGDAEAQYLYMMIYAEGIGVTPWPNTVRWWGQRLSAAARRGRAEAQWYWGLALENGLTGHSDLSQARASISQSADKGFPEIGRAHV